MIPSIGHRQRSLARAGRGRPRAVLGRRAARARAMPSTRIAFRPRPSFSRPSVDDDVEPGEVAHALEPVAHGVAVREQALGGAGDVAVGVEERLERLHEVGLVLLVVGDERLDRLGVEALQLDRVLAHRRQQQPVGAGVLEGEQRRSSSAPGLGDVGGEQRLVAGAVEVDRVDRDARVADREREAVAGERAARGAIALGRRGATARRRRRRGTHDHHVAGGVGRRPRRRAASEPGALARAAARRPRARGRASRPRSARSGARARRPPPRRRRGRSRARSARATMSPRSVTSRRSSARRNAGLRRLRRALGRAQALDLGGDQRRDDPQQRVGRLAAAGAHAQAPDDRVADPQLVGLDAGAVGHQRALVGGRARGDGEHGARAVDQHERGVERARGGAHDLGQADAGLDRRRGSRSSAAEVMPAGELRPASRARPSIRAGRSTRARRRRRRAPAPQERGEHVDGQDRASTRSHSREYDRQAGTSDQRDPGDERPRRDTDDEVRDPVLGRSRAHCGGRTRRPARRAHERPHRDAQRGAAEHVGEVVHAQVDARHADDDDEHDGDRHGGDAHRPARARAHEHDGARDQRHRVGRVAGRIRREVRVDEQGRRAGRGRTPSLGTCTSDVAGRRRSRATAPRPRAGGRPPSRRSRARRRGDDRERAELGHHLRDVDGQSPRRRRRRRPPSVSTAAARGLADQVAEEEERERRRRRGARAASSARARAARASGGRGRSARRGRRPIAAGADRAARPGRPGARTGAAPVRPPGARATPRTCSRRSGDAPQPHEPDQQRRRSTTTVPNANRPRETYVRQLVERLPEDVAEHAERRRPQRRRRGRRRAGSGAAASSTRRRGTARSPARSR